jgi:hypothetical protein
MYDNGVLIAVQVAKLMGATTIIVVGFDDSINSDFNFLANQLKQFGTNVLRLNQA